MPLYTEDDAKRCLQLFKPVNYRQAWQVADELSATLTPSGHMAGAAFVRLDSGVRSILFAGDIGRPNDPVLAASSRMDGADYLVVESTYGDRAHGNADVLGELAEVINRAAARGGVVLIPAFAVGRAQSLMYCIHLLKSRRAIADLPVYLNSPMAASATGVYACHQSELRLDPAQCKSLVNAAKILHAPDDSRELNKKRGPMIIIAASGMATGGRVLHHLKAFASDPRNTILFAGFQAGGTRGASISGEPPRCVFSQKRYRFAPKWQRYPTSRPTPTLLKSAPGCEGSNCHHARPSSPMASLRRLMRCDAPAH